MLYYGDRIIILDPLRPEVLEKLHGAHQGSSSMMLWANMNFFWLGMMGDIKKYRNMCLSCNECQPSNPNLPPKLIEEPLYPFQDICIDYCNYAGHKYGVMVCHLRMDTVLAYGVVFAKNGILILQNFEFKELTQVRSI